MFLITQFLATEALGKNTFTDRRKSAGSFPLFVRQLQKTSCVKKVLALHFKVKFDQLFVQRVLWSRLKLAGIKLESSEAYLPKLEKNLS